MHHDRADLLGRTTVDERIGCDLASAAVSKIPEHVDRPRIGHPRRATGRSQGLSAELNGELTSFVVSHPIDKQSGVQLSKRRCQPGEVVGIPIRDEIDVARRSGYLVRPSTEPIDEGVVDTVAFERLKCFCRLEFRFRDQPRRWLAGG